MLILDPKSHIAFLFKEFPTWHCRVNGPGSFCFFGSNALSYSYFSPGFCVLFSMFLSFSLVKSRVTYLFTIFLYFNPFSSVLTFFFLVLNETIREAELSSIIRHVSWFGGRYAFVLLTPMFTMHISDSSILFLSFYRSARPSRNLVNSS